MLRQAEPCLRCRASLRLADTASRPTVPRHACRAHHAVTHQDLARPRYDASGHACLAAPLAPPASPFRSMPGLPCQDMPAVPRQTALMPVHANDMVRLPLQAVPALNLQRPAKTAPTRLPHQAHLAQPVHSRPRVDSPAVPARPCDARPSSDLWRLACPAQPPHCASEPHLSEPRLTLPAVTTGPCQTNHQRDAPTSTLTPSRCLACRAQTRLAKRFPSGPLPAKACRTCRTPACPSRNSPRDAMPMT